MDNDDMAFQCDYQMIMKWLECENLVGNWLQNELCIMTWVMLTTNLHTHPPELLTYLPTYPSMNPPPHPLTYLPTTCPPTSYQSSYNLPTTYFVVL
jgi:hypothetical protein